MMGVTVSVGWSAIETRSNLPGPQLRPLMSPVVLSSLNDLSNTFEALH